MRLFKKVTTEEIFTALSNQALKAMKKFKKLTTPLWINSLLNRILNAATRTKLSLG